MAHMTDASDHDDLTNTLMLRPEDVLHACVAYTRPEMHTLNQIIALRSSGRLTTSHNTTTLASLPPEVLLRVRSALQASLLQGAAADTARALDEYEGALVDGLCADCFWWNHDIYGEDVWAWVENGYREACKCCVPDAALDDMALVSAEKARVARKYAGLEIYSRRQWLDAHIARTYLPAAAAPTTTVIADTATRARECAEPWRGLVKDVLAELGCECSAELEDAYDPSLGPALASRYIERKRALQCSFGLAVAIEPLHAVAIEPLHADSQNQSQSPVRRPDEDPAVTLRRVLRELQVCPPAAGDAPFPRLEGSSLRFTHKLQRKLCKPSDHYFRIEWHPSCNCMDCLLNLYPRAPQSNVRGTHTEANPVPGVLAPVARVLNEVTDRGIALFSSGFTCALSISALLMYRMLATPPPAAFA